MPRWLLGIFYVVIVVSLTSRHATSSTVGTSVMTSTLPSASFTFLPVVPYVNETVVFDASRSNGGDGTIIHYSWNFGDNTSGTGQPIEKSYKTHGNFNVTLTVTSNVGVNATTSEMILVLPIPVDLVIDLYNQKGGEGRNQPSEDFTPGSIVILLAQVTYNGAPVEYKPVSFEIRNAKGEIIAYRSAFTNASGVAIINFTLYTECLPNMIGTWVVLALTEVSGQKASDTLTFKVGGVFLDIYTQKPPPYSGRGPNMPSDAYAPQEEVILYGEAHYDCELIANKFVNFEIRDPNGVVIEYRVSATNEYGIATTSFRLASNATFGIYSVFGSVEILGEIANDTLTFRVGWIIESLELLTVDETGAPKTYFARGEHVCFNLTARNIAFTTRTATFTIVAHDESSVPIGVVILHGFLIEPGATQLFMVSIGIPTWVCVGTATAYANALTDLPTAGGIAYCPEVITTFTITSV
jgi:PKD repeat protein